MDEDLGWHGAEPPQEDVPDPVGRAVTGVLAGVVAETDVPSRQDQNYLNTVQYFLHEMAQPQRRVPLG